MISDAVQLGIISGIATVISSGIAAAAIIYGAKGVKQSVDGIVIKFMDAKDAVIRGKDERIAAVAISSEAKGVLKEKERADSIASPDLPRR